MRARHFFVISIVAKNNSFLAAWGVGNNDLFLMTLRSCRW